MNRFVRTLVVAVALLPLTVPAIGAAHDDNRHLRIELSGFNEVIGPNLGVGAVFSTGSGRLKLKIDKQNREIEYELSYEFPDAAATPMYASFQKTPIPTPFNRREARIPLDERNRASAPGAAASARMNFEEADLTPELELNEILWQSVHGPQSRMPPPVHAAFLRPRPAADDDDDDRPPKKPQMKKEGREKN